MSLKDFTILKDKICPNCHSIGMLTICELRQVPTNSCIMLPTKKEAIEYPKGDIIWGFCSQCGFISNIAFNPKLTEYSDRYEETQGFSPTFRKFHQELASLLINRYNLYGKIIIEIGCGKGDFLSLLCELGENRGIGFDPAYNSGRNKSKADDQITFVKDYFSEKYSFYQCDFLVCKMTLEHIPNPYDFLKMVRNSIGSKLDTITYFQVPDVMRILNTVAFEDIYYEHCSYFSPGSIGFLFENCGFNILHLSTTFDNQYLMLEAQPLPEKNTPAPQPRDLAQIKAYIETFQMKLQKKMAFWQEKLNYIKANGSKVVLWGSGSKAVAFLTTFNVKDEISYVVDINPYKHGFYLPGSGQKIISPSFLTEYQPDIVIIMNSIYESEIKTLINQMGLNSYSIVI